MNTLDQHRMQAIRLSSDWCGAKEQRAYGLGSNPRSVDLSPVEDYLPAVPRVHDIEALFVIQIGKSVSNHRAYVQTAFEHHRHFVPGLKHFAAVDTLEGQHAENYLVPVDCHLSGRNPQQGDLRTVTHVLNHLAESCRIAGHLETHVKTFLHAKFLLHLLERRDSCIHREGNPHLPGESQPVRIDVGDDQVPGTGMPHHCRRHNSDGTCPRNEYVLA